MSDNLWQSLQNIYFLTYITAYLNVYADLFISIFDPFLHMYSTLGLGIFGHETRVNDLQGYIES